MSTELCKHCDEPAGVTMEVIIVGDDRKIYDVVICAGCYEALALATPDKPSKRGWHGIMSKPTQAHL